MFSDNPTMSFTFGGGAGGGTGGFSFGTPTTAAPTAAAATPGPFGLVVSGDAWWPDEALQAGRRAWG